MPAKSESQPCLHNNSLKNLSQRKPSMFLWILLPLQTRQTGRQEVLGMTKPRQPNDAGSFMRQKS